MICVLLLILSSYKLVSRYFDSTVYVFVSAEEESMGWGPVLASLQVPELTVDDFLSESQSGGSFLTLYAFILQRLNSECTAANERRTLALINTWTNQVFPRFEPSFSLLVACCGFAKNLLACVLLCVQWSR